MIGQTISHYKVSQEEREMFEESKSGGFQPRLVKRFISVFIVWFALTGVAFAEQYLCVAEQAAGFSYDKVTKEWKNATFKASRKYVVSEGETKSYAFKVTRIGTTTASYFCESDFNELGFLSCSSFVGQFRFNKNNGRYLFSYPSGYFNVLPEENGITDEGSDTPLLEIGKCSPF